MLNCTRVEEVLPLYVAGDLADGEEGLIVAVAAHLRLCPACRDLEGRYHASRDWLRLYEPPEFDAAFYEELRANVLAEVALRGAPRRAATFASITGLFTRPTALAAALAALLVCAAVTLPLLMRAPTEKAEVAEEPGGFVGPVGEAPAPRPASGGEMASEGAPRRTDRARRAGRVVARRPRGETVNVPRRAAATEVAGAPPSALPSLPAYREMLRIELQTSDPNIRIIWLTPKAGDDLRKESQ